jgi:hypothetical protein
MSKKYEIVDGKHTVVAADGHLIQFNAKEFKELLEDYCVRNLSVEKICLKYKIKKQDLERYRRIIGFTRSPDHRANKNKGTVSETVITGGRGSLDEVLKTCSIDQKLWKVEDFSVKQLSCGDFIWTVYFKKNVTEVNFEAFKQELKSLSPVCPKINYPRENKDLLWECAIFDAHIGKLSYAPETGSNYDVKIASKIYADAVDFSIANARKFKIEKIIFPIGQDFLHVDGKTDETTAGTRQDTDGRSTKVFVTARKLLIASIEKLKTIAPVDVICTPGNHEENSMFHLGDCLECRYWNDENVTIFNDPRSRKYYQWGKNLIGYVHGDKTKINDLAVLMATESPKIWSQTKYRYWRLGHYHHQKLYVDEKSGVIIEVLPSISAADSWHSTQGYTENIRGAVSSMFDKEHGLIGKFYFNL